MKSFTDGKTFENPTKVVTDGDHGVVVKRFPSVDPFNQESANSWGSLQDRKHTFGKGAKLAKG